MAKGGLRWDWIALALILIAIFWLRMEFSTSVEPLSYDSYLTVREVDHIRETGKPLIDDPLSVTGRTRVGSPLFPYLLALLVPLGDAVYKILPNLLMVLLLVPVYLLAQSLTKSVPASLIAVALAGLSPSVFPAYLNTPSATPLAALLFLLIILLVENPDTHLFSMVGLTILLAFLSPVVFVLALSLLAIIVMLKLEGFSVDARINEAFFFTLMLAVWFHVLVYKRALFDEGIGAIWQNLPAQYVELHFSSATFIGVIYGLGTVAFLFGVFGAYHALFEGRARASFPVVGAILAVASLVLLRFVEIALGMLLLSVLLAIMAGYGLLIAARYLRRTKVPWLAYPLGAVVIAIFMASALLPALSAAREEMAQSPTKDDIAAFKALGARLPRGAVLLTTVREGFAVQHFSGHTTLTDEDFLLLSGGDELVRDIDSVYLSRFAVSVVGKAEKLGFTHVLFSNDAVRAYGRESLRVEESLCLDAVPMSSGVTVYRVVCTGVEP